MFAWLHGWRPVRTNTNPIQPNPRLVTKTRESTDTADESCHQTQHYVENWQDILCNSLPLPHSGNTRVPSHRTRCTAFGPSALQSNCVFTTSWFGACEHMPVNEPGGHFVHLPTSSASLKVPAGHSSQRPSWFFFVPALHTCTVHTTVSTEEHVEMPTKV